MNMKIPFLIFALLACIMVNAQGNFKVEDGAIIWQKVFDGEPTPHMLTDAVVDGSTITGKLSRHSINFKAQGLSAMNAPFIVQDLVNANVIIDKKDGRYRVTLSQLVSLNTNAAMGPIDQPVSFERLFLKKGALTTRGALVKSMDIIEADFDNLFKPKKVAEDW